ncbi:MAG: hypothetical protein R3C44_24215 [Chloroflexota bacterium]
MISSEWIAAAAFRALAGTGGAPRESAHDGQTVYDPWQALSTAGAISTQQWLSRG